MDRALLERMIGAAVLVLMFVVFAPMLLDGRDGIAVDDPTVRSAGSRTKVIVLNQPEPKPAPATAEASSQEKPTETARSLAAVKAIKPAAGNRNKPTSEAPRKGFAVQLGSFSSRDNAVGFAGSLQGAGYDVFVIRGASTGGSVYRVYAGPQATREAAEGLAGRLAKDGQTVMVVDLAGRQGD